jgi:dTDP-glucose 4,6-dehydratase
MIFFSSAEVYGDYEGIMSEDVMINNPIKDTYQMNAMPSPSGLES